MPVYACICLYMPVSCMPVCLYACMPVCLCLYTCCVAFQRPSRPQDRPTPMQQAIPPNAYNLCACTCMPSAIVQLPLICACMQEPPAGQPDKSYESSQIIEVDMGDSTLDAAENSDAVVEHSMDADPKEEPVSKFVCCALCCARCSVLCALCFVLCALCSVLCSFSMQPSSLKPGALPHPLHPQPQQQEEAEAHLRESWRRQAHLRLGRAEGSSLRHHLRRPRLQRQGGQEE